MKLWILFGTLFAFTACSHSKTATDSKSSAPAAAASKSSKSEEKAAPAKEAKGKHKKAKKGEAAEGETKAETATASGDHTTCKTAGDERVISIITKDGGCAVEYTKHAEKKEIASAQHETEHCKQVVQKVKGKLEAAGYTCN